MLKLIKYLKKIIKIVLIKETLVKKKKKIFFSKFNNR